MKPQGCYKTYNDIHSRLHQSEHAQSSCKLKRVGDELFTNGKRSVELWMSGNIDVHVRYRIYYM